MDGEAGWWTTSGNIGLPPLARAMGVGRQQFICLQNNILVMLQNNILVMLSVLNCILDRISSITGMWTDMYSVGRD